VAESHVPAEIADGARRSAQHWLRPIADVRNGSLFLRVESESARGPGV